MPVAPGVAKRALHAVLAPVRFLNRHQWLTSAIILAGAVATLILWTLLLPLPEAHGAYSIQKSLRFNDDDSANLTRSTGAGTSSKIFTFSAWVKRANLGTNQDYAELAYSGSGASQDTLQLQFNANDTLKVFETNNNAAGRFSVTTNQVFRDPSAWMHVVFFVDTTQATQSDRAKLFMNGEQVTSFSTATYPSQNDTLNISDGAHNMRIGATDTGGSAYLPFDGYLSDVYFIDGQALDPSYFGETDATTGTWKAKSYSGTFGTNGFHLNFTDSATLGNDVSGNNNDWTSNNLDATDQVRDTPTNNYAALTPLRKSSSVTLSNGNLDAVASATTNWEGVASTMCAQSGKWYGEFTLTTGNAHVIGIYKDSDAGPDATNEHPGWSATSYGIRADNGNKVNNGSFTAYGSGASVGDTISLALDLDNGKVWFGKNGTWQASGDPVAGTNAAFTGLSGTYCPGVGVFSSGKVLSFFGQGASTTMTYYAAAGGSFKYAPPQGYKALSTANLPTPAIARPSDHFDVATSTGTGATRSTTGIRFSPDLVWIKGRSGATDHAVYDAVRGAQDDLVSNSTAVSTTQSTGLTAFNSDGFTIGALAKLNTSAATYVAWLWNESPTAGFDIVTYTGNGGTQNISHVLGVAPGMIIVKARDSVQRWTVYHGSLSGTPYGYLNETFLFDTTNANLRWGNNTTVVPPTSSVFTVGNSVDVNQNTTNYVAYLFASIDGFSKFGSYTGNGSTDGPFVYTGFKPRFIIIKRSDAGVENWQGQDTARNPNNVIDDVMYMDTSNFEQLNNTAFYVDLLSNGFKIRTLHAGKNASGGAYVYAAFAESPFKYATAGATANAANFIAWEF